MRLFPVAITNSYFLEINFKTIQTFLLGLLTGFVLLAVFTALFIVTDRSRKTKHRFSKMTSLSDKTIADMIEQKQKEMIDTVKMTDNAYFKVAFDLSFELMNDIARYYFPESRYPMYELSIQEILDLNYYITKRIETLVNGRFIRRFKNSRVSTIINILNKKKAIDNSKLMKLSKKLQISKFYTVGKTVLNYANPIFWFRKLAIKPSTTLLTKEICKYIIQIFGDETNKIYGKKMYAQDQDDEEKLEAELDEAMTESLIEEGPNGAEEVKS